jgi:hypothetical protein
MPSTPKHMTRMHIKYSQKAAQYRADTAGRSAYRIYNAPGVRCFTHIPANLTSRQAGQRHRAALFILSKSILPARVRTNRIYTNRLRAYANSSIAIAHALVATAAGVHIYTHIPANLTSRQTGQRHRAALFILSKSILPARVRTNRIYTNRLRA